MILDTHPLLWWLTDDPRLSERARQEIAGAADVFVSSASAWEIAKNERLGKLKARRWDSAQLPALLEAGGFEILPISIEHALRAGKLAGTHADPFDRILIAQSQIEGLPIITRDPIFKEYAVEVIW